MLVKLIHSKDPVENLKTSQTPSIRARVSTPMIGCSIDVKKVTRSSDLEEEDVELVESGPRLPNVYVS